MLLLWFTSPSHAADEDSGLDLETRVHGYGDIGIDVRSSNHPPGFDVGDAILSYGANLGKEVALVSDFVFGLAHEGQWVALIDRLMIDLSVDPRFTLTGGKLYLPIGYWNTNIPYGSFLYAPQFRPGMLNFERHGAPLPVHQSGLDQHGVFPAGLWQLGYHLGVGNGRSAHLNETQDIGDSGPEKAVWLQVYVESPGAVQVGLSGYYDDRIQVGHLQHDLSEEHGEQGDGSTAGHQHADQVLLKRDTREAIAAAHVAWTGNRTEVLLEGVVVWHQRRANRNAIRPRDYPLESSFDGYAQISHEIEKSTPYFRVDYVEYWYDDPLYRDIGRLRVTGKLTPGVRVDVAPYAAVKFEGLVQRDVIFPLTVGRVTYRNRVGGGIYLAAGF